MIVLSDMIRSTHHGCLWGDMIRSAHMGVFFAGVLDGGNGERELNSN